MRKIQLVCLTLAIGMMACQPKVATDLTQNNVIPKPVDVTAAGGEFKITSNTQIFILAENGGLRASADYLQAKLQPSTGFDLNIVSTGSTPTDGIFLTLSSANTTTLGDEGYELNITEDLITLSAANPAGVFRGVQTIRQLLPNLIDASSLQTGTWSIATGKIVDYPEYEYRGTMLDVARHFFSVEDVKRYIDLVAGLKMNIMHLHLTDDQGWRLEIKSWPNLTAHGAKSSVNGEPGGFYTQAEYKDIVQYAADRYITIVPEIDVPSHTFAALVSYPELNCDGKVQEKIESTGYELGTDPYTGTVVGFCTFCTDKPVVFEFMNDVIREVAALTPGPYIHMGGDESHVTPLEDYIPFMEKMEKIVLNNGKTMIGWDEVAHAKLDSSSIVQYWAKEENTVMGVEQGSKVIISPAKAAYLDMQYDSTSRIGYHWAAYIEVDSAYRWDPTTLSDQITRESILGIEAPLWSETLVNMKDIEYLAFPRILGHAEIGWTNVDQRDWEDYKVRLGNQATRLKALDIDYYPSPVVPWAK